MVTQARALFNNKRGQWIDLSKVSSGTIFKQGNLKLEDGKSIFTVKETRGGNSAYDARNIYSSFENQDKFIQNIEENNKSIVSDFSITGYEEKNKPLTIDLIETKDVQFDDFIYLSPPISKLYKENPFKSETRTFPINFDHLLNYVQMIEIEIPEGYEVVEIPKGEHIILNENDLSYIYRITQQGNKLILNTRFQISKLLILPTEYEHVKDFFAKMINKNNEQIVLKKI